MRIPGAFARGLAVAAAAVVLVACGASTPSNLESLTEETAASAP